MNNYDKACKIAEILKMKHDFKPEQDWAGNLVTKSGRKLHLRLSGGPGGKGYSSFSIHPLSERLIGDHVTSIKFDPNKSPEKIAQDIERRLLPHLDALEPLIAAREFESSEYERKCAENKAKLLEASGTEDNPNYSKESFHFSLGDCYGEVQVSSDTASVKVRSVSIDKAIKIFNILKGD